MAMCSAKGLVFGMRKQVLVSKWLCVKGQKLSVGILSNCFGRAYEDYLLNKANHGLSLNKLLGRSASLPGWFAIALSDAGIGTSHQYIIYWHFSE